jgi:hypothetical protein
MESNPFAFFAEAKLELENPQYWETLFAEYLEAMDLDFSNNKTLAAFRDFQGAAFTGLTQGVVYESTSRDSEHFLIFACQLFDGTNGTVNQTDWLPGISDSLAKNGKLEINNNGSIVERLDLTAFVPESQNEAAQTVWKLGKPILWSAQTDLLVRLIFPTAIGTADYNIGFSPIGFKLIS